MNHLHIEQFIVSSDEHDVTVIASDDKGRPVVMSIPRDKAFDLAETIDFHARPDDDEILNGRQVADELGMTYRGLRHRVMSGAMPPPDIDVPDNRTGGRLRFWWRSQLERRGVIDREAGEGDFAGLLWAVVLLSVLARSCGIG